MHGVGGEYLKAGCGYPWAWQRRVRGWPEGRTKDSSLVSLVMRGGPLPTGSVRATGGRGSDVGIEGGAGIYVWVSRRRDI